MELLEPVCQENRKKLEIPEDPEVPEIPVELLEQPTGRIGKGQKLQKFFLFESSIKILEFDCMCIKNVVD